MMTHQGGNVESPCLFRSIRCTESRNYFLGTPANSALAWVTASQKISSTFSLDRPTTSTFATPRQLPVYHLGLGRGHDRQTVRYIVAGNWRRSIAWFAFSHH